VGRFVFHERSQDFTWGATEAERRRGRDWEGGVSSTQLLNAMCMQCLAVRMWKLDI